MPVKISIVIPCYNMGNFIEEAVNSVLAFPNQEDIEIIIVNDGSNDNGYTQGVLAGFNYPNCTIIHQENKGLGYARNTGIKNARAPFVLLLDADNKLRTDYIFKGLEIIESNEKVAVVYSDLNRFGIENGLVKVGSFDISRMLVKNYIDACVILRKSAWESVGGYDELMPVMGYEDWDLYIRLFFKGWEFYYLPIVGFDYRVREQSMLINSNQNRSLIISYMFSKEDMKQISNLRMALVDGLEHRDAYNRIQKRTVIKWALKLESVLKNNKLIFNNLKGIKNSLKK
ncbi:glycosyltransferase family 2 protein [Paucihalobacter ruber]|uniref:Glycosyltransferase family 2 protein n=1 Tax=Paucihalobacter ruber TaxID=2567861 RepID=A0A506PJX3_9FLAO|nr:glycosyltransferase family A protein [Paucihalobacter ruber]TPV33864.1 glycosyltransferase family 2 protein [Paucihalobacter ruber]